MQKTSYHRPQCAKWFSRYSISKSRIRTRWRSPFCRFSVSFSLKYDIPDAILQDVEKMKAQYLMSLCLKFCRLSGWTKEFRLISNFAVMATQTRIISLCSKTRDKCKKSVPSIFLQNVILPAVTIKLYCFKSLFEHHFSLNNRSFVFQ